MSFAALRMYVVARTAWNRGGGHIYSKAKDGALCGVDKRFPQIESAVNPSAEFEAWFANNEESICRVCVKAYRKFEAKRVERPKQ